METEKVLRAVLDRPDQTAAQLSALSGVNERTVKTVLQRNSNALDATRCKGGSTSRGRPALTYRIKDDWKGTIRSRIEPAVAPDPVIALVETLESAEAAMRDATTQASREQIFRLANLQSKVAHAALEAQPDKSEELELRLVRAETRLTDAYRGVPETNDWDITANYAAMKAAVAQPPRLPWQKYLGRLKHLVEKFDGKLIPVEGHAASVAWESAGQIAILIDAISAEPDPVSARVISAISKSGLPCVSFESKRIWESGKATNFLKELEKLADDPFFCLAPLYITLDSTNEMGKDLCEYVERIGNEKWLIKAVTTARKALSKSVQSNQEDHRAQNRFYGAFVENADAGSRLGVPRSVWRVCRAPIFVDVGDNPKPRDCASQFDFLSVGPDRLADVDSRVVQLAKAPPMAVIGSPMQVAAGDSLPMRTVAGDTYALVNSA